MNRQELLNLLNQSKLAAHSEGLLKHVRPVAQIVREECNIEPRQSRLNNAPDLPPDFEWPEHELGPYRFLAQFNLAELPPGMPSSPSEGLLSLFYQYDEDGECFWQDSGFVIARLFTVDQELVQTRPPKAVDIGDPIPIRFAATVDVPNYSWLVEKIKVQDWPIGQDLATEYKEFKNSLPRKDDYLFGYPTNHTLGYDPTPDYHWQSLLTLGSDDDLQWYWHDGDTLVTFIESEKLSVGDFSDIKSDAG